MQLFQSLAVAVFALFPFGILASPVPRAPKPGEIIPNNFIVVLKDDVSPESFAAHTYFVSELHNASIGKRNTGFSGLVKTFSIHDNFKAYAGEFDQDTIDEIASRSEVAFVEPNAVVKTQAMITQSNPGNWGLASVSHHDAISASTTSSYIYDSSAGSGTYIYVIDTGILLSHSQFAGRATWGNNFINTVNADENGHGTHVSAIAAGSTYGVAKAANLVAVKVLDGSGSGTTQSVLSGIEWTASDAQAKGRSTKSTANMSLGGFYSQAMNNAVQSAIGTGISFAVAAGNDEDQASGYSPASAPDALTVGAITSANAKAGFSNFGSAVDLFAPGDKILSAYIGSDNASTTLSGTSMASPHIAGLAAYLIALYNLGSPAAVRSKMVSLAISDVTNAGLGSPTIRSYNGNGA